MLYYRDDKGILLVIILSPHIKFVRGWSGLRHCREHQGIGKDHLEIGYALNLLNSELYGPCQLSLLPPGTHDEEPGEMCYAVSQPTAEAH